MIHALRRAGEKLLKSRGYYEWAEPMHCNCGTLLKEFMTNDELSKLCDGNGSLSFAFYELPAMSPGYWSNLDEAFKLRNEITCKVTGIPFVDVVKRLEEFGFEEGDWHRIEFLVTNSGRYGLYDSRQAVGRFMIAEADKLAKRRRKLAGRRLAKMKANRKHVPSMTASTQEEKELDKVTA